MIEDCNEFPSKGFGGDVTNELEIVMLLRRIEKLENRVYKIESRGVDE